MRVDDISKDETAKEKTQAELNDTKLAIDDLQSRLSNKKREVSSKCYKPKKPMTLLVQRGKSRVRSHEAE